MKFNIDDEVYWTDPQDEILSGYYFVKKILSDKIYLIGNALSIREVFEYELS